MQMLKSKKKSNYISTQRYKAFDFSANHTTISHSKAKDKLKDLVQLCFTKENE
jgi:hypothetical protein